MRRGSVARLAAGMESPPETPEGQAWDLMVESFGPRCAAWLAFKHRSLLHRRGVFDLVTPRGTKRKPWVAPQWMSLALACLAGRRWWSVEVIDLAEERRYRISWRGWMRQARCSRSGAA
jgi:hypothetical protein